MYRNANDSVIMHSSETKQDTIDDKEFHHIIYNNGTLEDLRREIHDKIIPILK